MCNHVVLTDIEKLAAARSEYALRVDELKKNDVRIYAVLVPVLQSIGDCFLNTQIVLEGLEKCVPLMPPEPHEPPVELLGHQCRLCGGRKL